MGVESTTHSLQEIPPEQWGPGYHFWQSILSLLAQRGPEGTTSLVRMASHLVLISLALAVLWLARVQLPEWDIVEVASSEAPAEETTVTVTMPESRVQPPGALVRAAIPFTIIPDRPRTDIITHTVEAGDTLYAIAAKYGISAETLMWANNMELNPDLLRLGQQLTILPVDGVLHTVAAGETVESIAQKYKAKPDAIVNFEWNHLDPRKPTLVPGQKLIVPGGTKPLVLRQVKVYTGPIPADARRGTGRFVWPTTGSITQGYKPLHRAVDIAAPTGTPVKASDSGYVVVAGWSDVGYGNYVVIDHGNGFQTLYAHLSRYFVTPGDSVGQGAVIGLVGSTGRSTGPHLHFEIRQNGIQRNPFGFLP